MRTASRRARRFGGLLLVAATVLWALMRRRANAVRWVEPPATLPVGVGIVPVEPGTPGELPDDVLATDAGLTELPESAAGEGPVETVDEALVAEILAESADGDVVVVDETTYEQALADAAGEPATADATDEAEAEVVATGPAAAEPAGPEAGVPADVGEESTEARAEAGVPPGVGEAGPEGAAAAGVGEESTEAGPAAELVAEVPSGVAALEEPTERELAAPGIEDSTVSLPPEAADEPAHGIAMPTFSEAPTAEIPAVTDNLRAVRGIGPSMERTLHALGIVSYRQLAMLDGAELERLRGELTDFRGRIEREDWIGQARALYREKYGRDPS